MYCGSVFRAAMVIWSLHHLSTGMVWHDNEAATVPSSNEAVSPQHFDSDSASPPDDPSSAARGVAAHVRPPAPIVQYNTFDVSTNVAPLLPPPGAAAANDAKLEFLHQQLDSLGTEKPAIQDLVLLGNTGRERRQGGVHFVYLPLLADKLQDLVDFWAYNDYKFHKNSLTL